MLSSSRMSDRNRPEQQKYLKWWVEETKKGLVDVKICLKPCDRDRNVTSEEIFKELNMINDAMANGECEKVVACDIDGNFI